MPSYLQQLASASYTPQTVVEPSFLDKVGQAVGAFTNARSNALDLKAKQQSLQQSSQKNQELSPEDLNKIKFAAPHAERLLGLQGEERQIEFNKIRPTLARLKGGDVREVADDDYLQNIVATGVKYLGPQKTEEEKNPLGGSLEANYHRIALTGDVNDPQTIAAYQALKAPKQTYNETTGSTVTITPTIPSQIESRFAHLNQGKATDNNTQSTNQSGVSIDKGEGKAAPVSMLNAYQSNTQQLRKIDKIKTALQDPSQSSSIGLQNLLPGANLYYSMTNPGATELRALVAGLQNMTIKDLSGATVTAAEESRLKPYIPAIDDPREVVDRKVGMFFDSYTQIVNDQKRIMEVNDYRIPELGNSSETKTVNWSDL